MSEMTLEFSGRNGLIALGAVALLLLVRLSTLGETSDPQLEKAIRAELLNELGNELGKTLASGDAAADPDLREAALERSDPDNIEVHAMSVSKPLLSFSSSADAVVHVEYELPGSTRRSEYWKFRHNTVGGWRYRYGSSALSYYLNFF